MGVNHIRGVILDSRYAPAMNRMDLDNSFWLLEEAPRAKSGPYEPCWPTVLNADGNALIIDCFIPGDRQAFRDSSSIVRHGNNCLFQLDKNQDKR